MKHFALEVLPVWDIWPLPVVQHAGTVDQGVAPVFVNVSLGILNFDIINTSLIVPDCAGHSHTELYILAQIVFVGKLFKVLLNLCAASIVGCILGVGPKGVGVDMRWHITGASRIDIYEVRNEQQGVSYPKTYFLARSRQSLSSFHKPPVQ